MDSDNMQSLNESQIKDLKSIMNKMNSSNLPSENNEEIFFEKKRIKKRKRKRTIK